MARVVIPGLPYHVTQRGNRLQPTFFGSAEGQQATRALRMAETTGRPIGDADWPALIEQQSGRTLAARKRGPKPNGRSEGVACI